MSLYLTRFSRFPRPVTQQHARAGLTRQLGYMGEQQVSPTNMAVPWHAGWTSPPTNWARENQMPGPFTSPDLSPHLYAPRNSENLDVFNWTPLPAIGSRATILSFRVPTGRDGIINKIANDWIGGGWIAGSGDVLWRILVDGASPPGTNTYHDIKASIGSQANPVGISGFRIFENQTISVILINNPAGMNGGVIVSGQQGGARLMGYLFPRDMQYHDTWV